MKRMSLTEAIEIANAYQQYGETYPKKSRRRAIKRLEHVVGSPMLRKQKLFNHAVVDALDALRLGMEGRGDGGAARTAFASHHEGIAALRRDMVALQQELADTKRELQQLESSQRRTVGQVDVFLNSVRRSLPEQPDLSELADQPDAWGQLYNAFEDLMRGSFEDIQDRFKVYLPDLPKGATEPVADIGCGRGEWLDLLKNNGIPAYGIDSNPAVAERAAGLGLEVKIADALEHLRSVPERSLSAVTAFHVAEHLPTSVLIELVDLALRALRPGGKLILETPNPANLTVGACTFWFDPTHLRPLPNELLSFIVSSRGFADVETRPLFRDAPPVPEPQPDEPTSPTMAVMVGLLNHHLGAASDYAVLGTRL
jgi:O-antigen chain-terminating methyltransferase